MSKGNLKPWNAVQLKSTYAALYLSIVFGGLGYVGLSKTLGLDAYKNIYLVFMLSGVLITLSLTLINRFSNRAILHLLLIFFQGYPIIIGSFCFILFSISNIADFNISLTFLCLVVFIFVSSIYSYKSKAIRTWKRNIKHKKYDIREGIFFPLKIVFKDSQFAKAKWLRDIGLLITVIFLSLIRATITSQNIKFLMLHNTFSPEKASKAHHYVILPAWLG